MENQSSEGRFLWPGVASDRNFNPSLGLSHNISTRIVGFSFGANAIVDAFRGEHNFPTMA